MSWNSWLVLADALMVGVILTVQLVVYPGFQYFSREDLLRLHKAYTRNITMLVAPLMIAQLIGGLFWSFKEPGVPPILYTLGIFALWVLTLLFFVPLHKQISMGAAQPETFKRLVALNWIRTLLWILILAWNLFSQWVVKP